MSEQKTIKKQAREILHGNYAPAVIGLVILILPIFTIDGAITALTYPFYDYIEDEAQLMIITTSISTVLTICMGLLFTPLFNGYIRMFYRASYTGEFDLSDLYYYFIKGRYSRTLSLNVGFALRMILPLALCFAPVIIFDVVCQLRAEEFIGTTLYLDFRFLLSVMSGFLVLLYSLRYFAVFTLYVENDRLSNRDIIRGSKAVMKEHSAHALKLYMSYLPWLLLCLTVLPILYVVPYLTQGLCIGAKWMTQAAFGRN